VVLERQDSDSQRQVESIPSFPITIHAACAFR
jgi:hypothetical protein